MRMYAEDYDKLEYWSKKYEMTRAELLIVAMDHYIGWRNGDYDLPRAERQRLNQLTDAIASLIVTNNIWKHQSFRVLIQCWELFVVKIIWLKKKPVICKKGGVYLGI